MSREIITNLGTQQIEVDVELGERSVKLSDDDITRLAEEICWERSSVAIKMGAIALRVLGMAAIAEMIAVEAIVNEPEPEPLVIPGNGEPIL